MLVNLWQIFTNIETKNCIVQKNVEYLRWCKQSYVEDEIQNVMGRKHVFYLFKKYGNRNVLLNLNVFLSALEEADFSNQINLEAD